ncbi:hypothetical protein PsorP6_003769 [Peronosclerospora sorghi]|uniref:Uncharacterized protein n=1 Tax=Peronosclerospora sorghi TaxID=230839 RepID=A0ACC0VR73_9STRA|nr:hypothetical protein PsorP6_003769 [Peronosclerospora sorghi]
MAHLGTTYQYCEALSAHAKAQRHMASFPLSQRPFGRLNLTENERRRFHTQATELLGSALQEYEEFALIRHHQVDRRRWKPIKTREQLTIYRESRSYVASSSLSGKDDSESSARHNPTSRSSSGSGRSASGSMSLPAHQVTELELLTGWGPTATEARELKKRAKNFNGPGKSDRLPTLLGVGTIIGSLDDVMYGVAAFDCASMALKQDYAHEDVLDGDVVAAIEGPTQRSPFRFLGIKWLVKSLVGGKHKGISPRDLVYLEATGVITRGDGVRIGYQILHSVKLRHCPELKNSHGVTRAQCESAHLFVELNNKTVDVFLKSHVTPNGKISESAALQSCANSLLYCSKTMQYSQDRKLMWQLECTTKSGRDHEVRATHCSVCSKSFGLLRTCFKCKLCLSAMCSKCCIERTLKRVDASGDKRHTNKVVSKILVELCTSCVAKNLKASALTLAREEVISGRFGRTSKSSGQDRGSDYSEYSSSIATITIEEIPGQHEYLPRPPRRSQGSNQKCYQSESRENRGSHRELVKSRDGFDVGDNKRRHQSHNASPDVSKAKRGHIYDQYPPARQSKHHEQPNGRARAGSYEPVNSTAHAPPPTIRRGQSGGVRLKVLEAEYAGNEERLLSPESIFFDRNPPAGDDDAPVEFTNMGNDRSGRRVDLCDLDHVPTYKLSKSSIRNTTSSSGSSLEGISALNIAVEEPEVEDDDIGSVESFDSFGDLIGIHDDMDDVYETLDTKDMEAVKPSFQTDRQLWQQIADLRDAAENVYQYTKESTALHMTQGGSIRSPPTLASK